MISHMKGVIKSYAKDTSGQFAAVFAIVALPLIAVTTLAIDHNLAYKKQLRLENALDDTALASVLNQTLSESERAKFADNYFSQLFDKSEEVNLKVLESGSSRVSLAAEADVSTTFASIYGKDSITVSQHAVAELTKGSVVCLLALDPEGDSSFEVKNGAEFSAKTCSVQVNSTHKRAALVHEGGKAIAQDFCISGGAGEGGDEAGQGGVDKFEPFANTDCGRIADPYQYHRIPAPDVCIDQEKIDTVLNHWHSEVFFPFEYEDFSTGRPETIKVEGGVTLQPGTYCGGLSLAAKNVTFAPGEYIIKDGPLKFGNGTRAFGEDVAFVFAGKEAILHITDGADVDLSAPERGDLKGLVFAQFTENRVGRDAILPNGTSVITAGGNLKLVGTAYLPEQRIEFIGGSISEAQAPATSFIGYQLLFDEGAKISVAVDHQTAGLPPLLPRSDESARIVQ